jgi:hypothetical protein
MSESRSIEERAGSPGRGEQTQGISETVNSALNVFRPFTVQTEALFRVTLLTGLLMSPLLPVPNAGGQALAAARPAADTLEEKKRKEGGERVTQEDRTLEQVVEEEAHVRAVLMVAMATAGNAIDAVKETPKSTPEQIDALTSITGSLSQAQNNHARVLRDLIARHRSQGNEGKAKAGEGLLNFLQTEVTKKLMELQDLISEKTK